MKNKSAMLMVVTAAVAHLAMSASNAEEQSHKCEALIHLGGAVASGTTSPNLAHDLGSLAIGSPSRCDHALELGGKAVFCIWEHAFRDKAAQQRFQVLEKIIGECGWDAARESAEKPVNHPDSYWVRSFQRDRDRLMISVKDKSQLNKTLVVVRLLRTKD